MTYTNPLYQEYALGFMFSDDYWNVILIEKAKPDWQRGLLNGVGGHVEEGELPIEAMVREFEEETGVKTDPEEWIEFAALNSPVSSVICFVALNDDHWTAAKTKTLETIVKVNVRDLLDERTVPNIPWLVHLAKTYHATGDIAQPVIINYN